MKRKALAALIGAGMLAASSVWAQPYLGAAIGQAKFKNACEGAPSAITCNDKDRASKFFGGYQFDLSAMELGAVLSWPLARRFAVFGRLGMYVGEMERGGGPSIDDPVPAVFPPPPPPRLRGWRAGNNTGATFGIGAAYDLTQNAALRVEWQRYNKLGPSDSPKIDIDFLSIGALFRF